MSIILLLVLIFGSQQVIADKSPKPCTVIEVVNEGTRSDCKGWKPVKGEKMIMSSEINKQLKVGDVFYFVWKTDRWVAQLCP